MERRISPDSILLLKTARAEGINTTWDRYEAQLPQCGFGETGLCCRHCLQGPCRIDPFGVTGPKFGICGATADVIVARGLARSIAGGTSSHSAHAKHLAHTLLKFNTRHLTLDLKHPTSEATILNYQGERTQLVFFQPRTYRMPKLASSRCIYYTAMGEKHATFDRGLAKELLMPGGTATVEGYPNRSKPEEMRAERISVGGKTVELR